MNERTLLRRIDSEVPKRDPEAKERARAILRAEMGVDLTSAGGRRFRPVLAWTAAAASIVLVFVLVLALRPGQQASPPATALDRLAQVASADTALDVAPDQYLFTSDESLQRSSHSQDLGQEDLEFEYRLMTRAKVETWVREDGAGRRVTTILNVRFLSDDDRAEWVVAGRPDLPKAGDVAIQRFPPGGFFLPDLSGLPTDPIQLRAVLETGVPLDQASGDANLAIAIGQQLSAQVSDPRLRVALFQILADLPPVRALGPMLDPLGREVIGFAVPEGVDEHWFLFDPDTARFLTIETVHLDGSEPSWLARTTTAVVDRLKERPAAA
jgi:hypothetical protein